MNHPNASDWIALVRGEHSGLVAARLRRHLKHCPHCAVELKEITNLLAAAKPHVPTVEKSLASQAWAALPSTPMPSMSRLRSLTLVGSAALVVGVSLLVALPGGPLRPTPSFAAVKTAMGKVKTVHWTETFVVEGRFVFNGKNSHFEDGGKGAKSTSDCWIDVEAHTFSERKDDQIFESIMIINNDFLFMLDRNDAATIYRKYKFSSHKATMDSIFDQIITPSNNAASEISTIHNGIKMKTHFSPWKQSEGELAGKKLLLFVREEVEESTEENSKTLVTVWVEPQTMQIVRRERVTTLPRKKKVRFHRVAENFRYNELPPPGTFEMPKPEIGEDYRYIDGVGENQEGEAIRRTAKQVIDAYNKRDVEGFLALWDETAVPQAKRRAWQAQWRKMVIEHPVYKTWRYGAMHSGLADGQNYGRDKETDPFPPPTVLARTLVESWVTTDKQGKPYLAKTGMIFTKRSGQWKLQELKLLTTPFPTASEK